MHYRSVTLYEKNYKNARHLRFEEQVLYQKTIFLNLEIKTKLILEEM